MGSTGITLSRAIGVSGYRHRSRSPLRFHWRATGGLGTLGNNGALVVLYYLSAKVGYLAGFSGPVAAVVWLPAGVGIAYLALRGLQWWPGVVLGDLLVNNWSVVAAGGGIGQTVGNVLEVVIGAALIRHRRRGTSLVGSVGGVCNLLAAIAAGTAVSALLGPLSLLLSGVLSWQAAPTVVRTWWLGDTTGAFVVVPLAVAWSAPPVPWRLPQRALAFVLAATVALSWVSLHQVTPLPYLVFPALILSAMLFGARGGTASVAVAAAFAVFQTTHYQGPFSYDSVTRDVLNTQLFIGVITVTTLLLAALLAEREALTERLEIALAETVRAVYDERRQLERNLHDGAQQRLHALRMKLAELSPLVTTARAKAALEGVDHEARIALAELRALARGEFPPLLVQRGLAGAVTELAEQSPLRVLVLGLPQQPADVPSEAAAYFVVAEALTNAAKHAHADRVFLSVSANETTIHVTVADNGHGTAEERPGSGLAGLRERIERLGGTFSLRSSPALGTWLSATIPVAAAAERLGNGVSSERSTERIHRV